jgi:alpha-1,2-mannosyltransferase
MPDPTECREPTKVLQCLQMPFSMELRRTRAYPRLTRRNIALEKTSSSCSPSFLSCLLRLTLPCGLSGTTLPTRNTRLRWVLPNIGRCPGCQETPTATHGMRAALSWVRDHPHGRLYDRVFFADKVKFQYPPSSLFIFQLMSAAGLDTTNLSMNRINFWFIAANALATGAFTFSIARRSPYYVAERWTFAVIGGIGALLFFPLMRAFSLGQVQVWINTLFALSALSYLSGRKRLAGILIGVICLLKPQFSMFIVWGLLRREWRFLTGCSVVLALGVATSLAVFGLQNHLDYLSVLRALSRSGESFFSNQSFNGLLNRLYSVDDPMIWQPNRFPPFNPVVYTGTLVTSALLIGGCLLLPLLGRGVSSVVFCS